MPHRVSTDAASPVPNATVAWGYLGHLYVLPQARGRNIGEELVMALLAEARSRRYSKVVLSPKEESVPLYRRCGFGADHQLLMWRPSDAASVPAGDARAQRDEAPGRRV